MRVGKRHAAKELELNSSLNRIVVQYSIDEVERALAEIRRKSGKSDRRDSPLADESDQESRKRRQEQKTAAKMTASRYVSQMDVQANKKQLIEKLAAQYDDKLFLSSIGEIRNFFQIHSIAPLKSASRASCIPRLFKFISELECQEMRAMAETGRFSGPSRLGPLSDSIRQYSLDNNASRLP